jgi:hypothetical protein
MNSSADELLKKHPNLVHSEDMIVLSHTQRQEGDWYLNTLMLKGYDVPFKYKRTKKFRSLLDQKVNITYYPEEQVVAGFKLEIMQIIRLRRC